MMLKESFRFANVFKLSSSLLIIALMSVPTYYIFRLSGNGIYGFHGDVLRFSFLFVLLFAVLMHFMDGFHVGRFRIHEIIFSILTSVFITDAVLEMLLFIFDKKTTGFLPSVLVIFTQMIFAVIYAYCANKIYCKIAIPQDTLIICADTTDAAEYISKVSIYKNSFKITGVISPYDPKLFDVIDKHEVIHLVDVPHDMKLDISEHCFGKNKLVYIVPDFFGIMLNNCKKLQFNDTLVLQNSIVTISEINRIFKRVFDIVFSLIIIILSLPIILIAALSVKLFDGGEVIFKQERVTLDYKKFNLYKFRTMVMDAEKNSGAMLSTENDPRITAVGNFLRKTRIDELPQLWNVFKGDMSLIGPRPERDVFIQQYCSDFPDFKYRLNVKAGITGLAQVYGKYNTTPQDKIRMDLYYIVNYSILLDLKICLLTIKTVFTKSSTQGVKSGGVKWYSSDSPLDTENIRKKLLVGDR